MAGTALFINPRKRRSKKHRSAAQRAATAKLVRYNKAHRSSNPKRRRRKAHHAVRSANPVRRYRRRHNPVVHHHRRRRRNPIGHDFVGLVKTGAVGAAGALVVDLSMGYLPIPAQLAAKVNADGSTNYLYYLTKAGLALAIGMFGRKVTRHAPALAIGAMTVTMYDLGRSLLGSTLSLGYYSPAFTVGQPVIARGGLGQYVSGAGQYVSALPNRRPSNVMPMSPGRRERLSAYK